ncbi:MAG: hypothetical protein ACXWYH_12145 [Actinomycetota bacterium]
MHRDAAVTSSMDDQGRVSSNGAVFTAQRDDPSAGRWPCADQRSSRA